LITPDRNGRPHFTNASDRRRSLTIIYMVAMVLMFVAQHVRAAESISWVPFRAIFLRVDDESPKEWNVWRDAHAKKDEILLVQWNKRYLRINTKLKEVREVDPQTLVHKDKSIESPADDSSAKILASDGWILRDVGSADRIYFELTEENHKVDINIPHGGR
jgi:hypothetical protein